MVVLPSTGASRYHNCCIDGGTSMENFGSTHVLSSDGDNISAENVPLNYEMI